MSHELDDADQAWCRSLALGLIRSGHAKCLSIANEPIKSHPSAVSLASFSLCVVVSLGIWSYVISLSVFAVSQLLGLHLFQNVYFYANTASSLFPLSFIVTFNDISSSSLVMIIIIIIIIIISLLSIRFILLLCPLDHVEWTSWIQYSNECGCCSRCTRVASNWTPWKAHATWIRTTS